MRTPTPLGPLPYLTTSHVEKGGDGTSLVREETATEVRTFGIVPTSVLGDNNPPLRTHMVRFFFSPFRFDN